MARKYYPYLPWTDDPIAPQTINHHTLQAVTWLTEGIYGPYAMVLRWLTAQDNKKLIADTRVLCVVEPES